MKITRTDKEYGELIKEHKKAHQQAKICPCCGAKSRLFFGPIASVEIFETHSTRFYSCRCFKCGALWQTDSYRITNLM